MTSGEKARSSRPRTRGNERPRNAPCCPDDSMPSRSHLGASCLMQQLPCRGRRAYSSLGQQTRSVRWRIQWRVIRTANQNQYAVWARFYPPGSPAQMRLLLSLLTILPLFRRYRYRFQSYIRKLHRSPLATVVSQTATLPVRGFLASEL